MSSLYQRIAEEISTGSSTVAAKQVEASVQLLDEGATVPFISRYRKEVTGGLDDQQLRLLEERLRYLRELEERRETIIKSIDGQDKLTEELHAAILAADNKTALEDLYLPYKPKRRTKGQIATEAGLLPLADDLLANPTLDPEAEAAKYITPADQLDPNGKTDTDVKDSKAALDGARAILMERFSEDATLLENLRARFSENAVLTVKVAKDKESSAEAAKFTDYFDYSEKFSDIPSHRALAIFRGRNENILSANLDLAEPENGWGAAFHHPCEAIIASHINFSPSGRPADNWLTQVCSWTWKVKLQLHLSSELFLQLREKAEAEAIKVFSTNLRSLLLAAPAGAKATMGLDPGLRTGVKVAVVDHTGKYLDCATIYPHAPKNNWDGSIAELAALAKKHNVELIAIGNGTASRETDKLAGDLIKLHRELPLQKVIVNEAGASIYSASEFAAKEFPELDVTIRGAISIARRLQDPLAELVKIEPKSIGVGQYQHDVNQTQLARSLDAVVEDCVNDVGVDLNMASAPLLKRVSGISDKVANSIVEYRNTQGQFHSRNTLTDVPNVGPKTFEQAAGFLRIAVDNTKTEEQNPLDASGVHPEAYDVVHRIANKLGKPLSEIVGNKKLIASVSPQEYVDEKFGLPTVTDILKELGSPGRDPRPEFKMAALKEGVETIKDLTENLVLEGTITNVTNFGAFVDIGVHQDGLVHISCLSENFVKDPHSIVKAGDIVKVKVMEVDVPRKRISLTMRLSDQAGEEKTVQGGRGKPSDHRGSNKKGSGRSGRNQVDQKQKQQGNSQMASQLAALLKK